jgi:hypothetical protein
MTYPIHPFSPSVTPSDGKNATMSRMVISRNEQKSV